MSRSGESQSWLPLLGAAGVGAAVGAIATAISLRGQIVKKDDEERTGALVVPGLERRLPGAEHPAPVAIVAAAGAGGGAAEGAASRFGRRVGSLSPTDVEGGGELRAVLDVEDTIPTEEFAIKRFHVYPIETLKDRFPREHYERNTRAYRNFIAENFMIVGDVVRRADRPPESRGFVRAGPRTELYFRGDEVKAAIVTCGGLCPGLNNVIRELTLSLYNLYGVREVLGLRNGFIGLRDGDSIPLTPEVVSDIQLRGGSMLGAARGGLEDPSLAVDYLRRAGINMLFVIGGDGSHRGANVLRQALEEAGLPVAIGCICKSIDNDIAIIDHTFGFQTAVSEAVRAVTTAKVEASCIDRGVGIVKLMGRSAGFIAAQATLASGVVDLCLVPEVPIVMDGETGILKYIEDVIERKGHAVIVVAEGAGQDLIRSEAEMAGKAQRDAGGNIKLKEIGLCLRKRIDAYLKELGKPASIKYIDPSYMVRAVPANPRDSIYCMLLAQNAVHAAMAGFTAFSVGLCNNRMVYIPIETIVRKSPRVMNAAGRTWERVIAVTGQPDHALGLPVMGSATGRTL